MTRDLFNAILANLLQKGWPQDPGTFAEAFLNRLGVEVGPE